MIDDPARCLIQAKYPCPSAASSWSAAILSLQRCVPAAQAHGIIRRVEIEIVAELTAVLRPEDAGAAAERALSHELHDRAR